VIAGLLLAAGRGRRFGADKLSAKLAGKAVIRWSAAALAPAVDAMFVVVPIGAKAVNQALSRLDVCFVENLSRDEGIASSIRAGIAALPSEVEAVVIALADQPYVDPNVAVALCERWRAGGVAAVAPAYSDGRGHPVLFARECFGALLELRGDVGARGVLEALGERAATIRIDAAAPIDVDTVEDLQALEGERDAR
jgi:molybdenum cofactor cytidylyltransferase